MTADAPAITSVMAVVDAIATGELTVASQETLTAARTLADGLGAELVAAFTKPDGQPGPSALASLGARKVYRVRSEPNQGASAEAAMEATWLAVQKERPRAVLFPDTQASREIAARTATRLECELVSGCTLLKVRDHTVQIGRPCLSGKGFAQFEWHSAEPIVITVAPGAFPAAAPSAGVAPDVVALEAPAATEVGGITVISEVAPQPEAMGVNDADVLVAGGAGVGGSEGFGLLMELARRLGGTVAASRVAVDRGWMPSARQVGLTGRTVAPRLYLAFGISGAPQHIAGIRSAGKVVAINSDPKAPIFQVADLAVVADLHTLIPGLLERLPNGSVGAQPEGELSR